MSAPAIRVDELSKRFRLHTERRTALKERVVRGRGSHQDFWALRDVSFDVAEGSTFALIGHNGSGKSTLLKVLAGIYRPTSGSVASNGRISAMLELGAGFHPELTGRENVYLNGAILGLSRKQVEGAIEGIIDFSGIGDFIDSPVKVYSTGMYVRLGFSIAVTVDPEILVVDEIIAVGDEEFQRKCFDHLFELRRRGTTIVLVTHSLGLVQDLCDSAVWLDHGKARALGNSRDVVDAYLRDVNEREAAAAPGGVGLPEGSALRPGSGEARVVGVDYLNAGGGSGPFVLSGEAARIRLLVHARRAVEGASVAISVVHESGAVVASSASGGSERFFDFPPGDSWVEYDLAAVPFQPGTYWMSTVISDRGHIYDAAERVFELRVRGGGGARKWG